MIVFARNNPRITWQAIKDNVKTNKNNKRNISISRPMPNFVKVGQDEYKVILDEKSFCSWLNTVMLSKAPVRRFLDDLD